MAGAASILWIASLATITDTVGSANMGKTMGIVGPICGSGGFLGPVVAGGLLSAAGYWPTWSVAVAIVSLDLVLRLAMTEKPKPAAHGPRNQVGADLEDRGDIGEERQLTIQASDEDDSCSASATLHHDIRSEQREKTISIRFPGNRRILTLATGDPDALGQDATCMSPLLPSPGRSDNDKSPISKKKPLSYIQHFLLVLRQRRIVSSMLLNIILSRASNSFNTTLAVQVEEAFGWGPRQVGLLFLALAGPSVLLGPSVGWLRDCIGVRVPTIIGSGLSSVLYVLIGVTGSGYLHSWSSLEVQKGIFIAALVLMGIAIEMISGICIIEGTRTSFSQILVIGSCPDMPYRPR